jgi:hypothetical protein
MDNNTWTEVPVLLDDLDELSVGLLASSVGIDVDRERLSYTNRVRELDKHTAGKATGNQRFGCKLRKQRDLKMFGGHTDPASSIGSRAVDLGEVFAGEGTPTMGTPSTVRIDDDLTTSKTGVTLRTANNEAARGLDLPRE